jgi:Fe-S cluster assembly protein SufD
VYAPELTAELPGPAWLRELRAGSAERAAAAPLPTVDEEEWRYSPIDELVLDRFAPVLAPVDPSPLGPTPTYAVSARLTTVDGFLTSCEINDSGVEAGSAVSLDQAVESREGVDVFAQANLGFTPDPIVIKVGRGVHIDSPIVIEHMAATDGGASFARVHIEIGDDSEVEIIERFSSVAAEALSVPVTHLSVGAAARVRYQQTQDLGVAMWQLGALSVDVGSQATFEGGLAAMGGGYARVRTDCRLVGRGATGNLSAVYFGDDDQTLDFRVYQDHIGRDTSSNLVFRGIVDGNATSIYTGLIRVGPEAAGTVAYQTNRAIKLGEHAWAESVPNLEIENNDVHCSHASTVSPVDSDQLFYLESRGVPTPTAERLVVEGFMADVINQMPVAEVRSWLTTKVQEKLDGRSSR